MGDGPADAATCAGNNHGLAGEVIVVVGHYCDFLEEFRVMISRRLPRRSPWFDCPEHLQPVPHAPPLLAVRQIRCASVSTARKTIRYTKVSCDIGLCNGI